VANQRRKILGPGHLSVVAFLMAPLHTFSCHETTQRIPLYPLRSIPRRPVSRHLLRVCAGALGVPLMILNTDLLKTRKSGNFIAIYGTQENPFSTNYDFMYHDEAVKMATALQKIAQDISETAARLEAQAQSLTP
jgi:hypothetical protein